MAAVSRMQQGRPDQAHAAAFARAEKEYGVPPAVIAAFFWGPGKKAISAPTWAPADAALAGLARL